MSSSEASTEAVCSDLCPARVQNSEQQQFLGRQNSLACTQHPRPQVKPSCFVLSPDADYPFIKKKDLCNCYSGPAGFPLSFSLQCNIYIYISHVLTCSLPLRPGAGGLHLKSNSINYTRSSISPSIFSLCRIEGEDFCGENLILFFKIIFKKLKNFLKSYIIHKGSLSWQK